MRRQRPPAEHAPADVGREALARAAQVGRIDARQVIPPEAELRDRQQAERKDAPLEHRHAARREDEEDQRHQEQPGDLEDAQQLAAAQDPDGQEREDHPADQAAGFRYADLLHVSGHAIDDEAFAALIEHYDTPEIIELTAVASAFEFFTRMNTALRIPVTPLPVPE